MNEKPIEINEEEYRRIIGLVSEIAGATMGLKLALGENVARGLNIIEEKVFQIGDIISSKQKG
jgi:hypothetical protein